MTIWVQCLRAPRWDEELDAWRVSGSRGSASLSGLTIGFERKPANSMHPEEKQGGIGGDETVETTDVANSPSRTQEEADSNFEKDEDIENQLNRERKTLEEPNNTAEIMEDEYSVDGSNAAAPKAVRQKDGKDKSSFTVGQCVRNRSKESTSATKTMKRNLRNNSLKGQILAFDKNNSYDSMDQAIDGDDKHRDAVAQTTSKTENGEVGKTSSFMKSMRNKLPRVQIRSSGKNKSQRESSLVSDLMCSAQPIHHEPPKATTTYNTDTDYDLPTVDKSVAADTGKHAVDLSQAPTNDPGFHISCVFPDGSKQEAHFPSMSNCCIGMGDPEEEEETKFQRFPQVSKDFQMVGFDDNDDYEIKNSRSADFLVRKLRKEEEVAAARRAKRNMAPVASFEFVRSDIHAHGDRRKNGNGGQSDAVINDDVSEMTRGSGWASGVSEILDDTDLRHQPKAILDGLSQKY